MYRHTLYFQDLSHDPKVAEDNKNDPLCKPYGTIRGLDDMLRGVILFTVISRLIYGLINRPYAG